MPMLGDVLAAARRSAGPFRAWMEASDPDLMARVAAQAADEGVSAEGLVRVAVAAYTRYAGEEDWATLSSGLRTNSDPGTACLLTMVRWYLRASAASAVEDGGRHHPHEE